MSIIERKFTEQYPTVTSETVHPEHGAAYRLYHVPGYPPMRWPQFRKFWRKQAEEAREARADRGRPGQTY